MVYVYCTGLSTAIMYSTSATFWGPDELPVLLEPMSAKVSCLLRDLPREPAPKVSALCTPEMVFSLDMVGGIVENNLANPSLLLANEPD